MNREYVIGLVDGLLCGLAIVMAALFVIDLEKRFRLQQAAIDGIAESISIQCKKIEDHINPPTDEKDPR
jgi:hypothetical protein